MEDRSRPGVQTHRSRRRLERALLHRLVGRAVVGTFDRLIGLSVVEVACRRSQEPWPTARASLWPRVRVQTSTGSLTRARGFRIQPGERHVYFFAGRGDDVPRTAARPLLRTGIGPSSLATRGICRHEERSRNQSLAELFRKRADFHLQRILNGMSRAFVKERDGEAPSEEMPERPISAHPNYVTPQGLALIDREIIRLGEEYAASDEPGRGRLARDLRYWRSRRASAEVVLPAQSDEVRFSSSFTIRRADGRVQSFRIVGEDEADPAAGSISYVSPLARAVAGKAVGDVILIGNGEAEIIEVS